MSLKATVLFAAAMLAVASAGLVHPKSKSSSAALPETNVGQQALAIDESARDGKALGGFGKDATLKDALLTRNIDPTLLSLEQNLIADYCSRDTVQAFKTVCKGLGQPAVYKMCTDLSTDDLSGSVTITSANAAKKCAFFISTPGYYITLTCRVSATPSAALDKITIDEADNVGANNVQVAISTSKPQAKNIKDAARIIFEDQKDTPVNYECAWTTSKTPL